MASEKVVSYRELGPDGKTSTEYKLDTNNGFLYDLKGNQVAKWEPANDERTAMLADYARDMAGGTLLRALASGIGDDAKERAISAARALMSERDALLSDKENAVLMDLGTGDVHLPAAMSNFASGYKNEAPLADIFAPPLLVTKTADKFYQFAKEDAFQLVAPIQGAAGGAVAEISPRLANDPFITDEYALGGFVSTQLEANADAPLRIRQATLKRVMNALTLMREKRVVDLAQTSGSWDSSVVATIAAGAKWNGGVTSDPIKDLQDRMEASWGSVTGIIWSERVWHNFLRNPAVQKYVTYKDGVRGVPDVRAVMEQFGLPPIYVAKMKYINSSGALDYVWGNHVVMVRQPDQMPPTTQDDVATAYTFRWNGSNITDGVTSGGFTVREYFVQDRGSRGGNKVVCVHNDAEKFTSKFVGGLILSAYQ